MKKYIQSQKLGQGIKRTKCKFDEVNDSTYLLPSYHIKYLISTYYETYLGNQYSYIM